MIAPTSSAAPPPNEDMPEDVKADFEEARNIVNQSPRSAAALLRLALQKLMPHLGEKGKNVNADIGRLVEKGLPTRIQKAMDAVRVYGNGAVHPGMIDFKDDTSTAIDLFHLLNVVIEDRITHPRLIDAIYDRIPAAQREAIQLRDKASIEARIDSVHVLAEQQNLSTQDKDILEQSIPGILLETSSTGVAASRVRTILSKGSREGAQAFRDILVDIVTETAKKILFP